MSKEFAALASKKGTLIHIDPDTVQVEKKFNHRDFRSPENINHIEWLANSIEARGVEKPLTVRMVDGVPHLVDGECRLRAVKLVNKRSDGLIKTVPCVEFTGTDAEALSASISSNGGKPPAQWEVGAGYSRLVSKFGWTEEEVAKDQGVPVDWVKKAILLAEADDDVKALLAKATVTAPFVIAKIKKHGGVAASLVIKEAVKKVGNATDGPGESGESDTSKAGKKGKKETLKREKASSGYYFKPDDLVVLRTALDRGAKSDDPNISATAEAALARIQDVIDRKDKAKADPTEPVASEEKTKSRKPKKKAGKKTKPAVDPTDTVDPTE